VAQVVECLHNNFKALSLSFKTEKTKTKTRILWHISKWLLFRVRSMKLFIHCENLIESLMVKLTRMLEIHHHN
jgi:hypothetical protein